MPRHLTNGSAFVAELFVAELFVALLLRNCFCSGALRAAPAPQSQVHLMLEIFANAPAAIASLCQMHHQIDRINKRNPQGLIAHNWYLFR